MALVRATRTGASCSRHNRQLPAGLAKRVRTHKASHKQKYFYSNTNMKRIFKSLIGLVCIAAMTAAVQAQVNNYVTPSVVFSTAGLAGNVISNATSSAVCTNIYVCPGKNMAVQMVVRSLSTACTSNLTAVIKKSVDGSNWYAWDTINLAATGATAVTCVSNYTDVSWPYVKFEVSTTALTAVPITNSSIIVWSK